MSKFFVRLQSLSNLACEVQEIAATDAASAFRAGSVAAANWGVSNRSEAVTWRVETYSGKDIGWGQWNRTPTIPQEDTNAND